MYNFDTVDVYSLNIIEPLAHSNKYYTQGVVLRKIQQQCLTRYRYR